MSEKKPCYKRYVFEEALISELEELCELYSLDKSFTQALVIKIEQSKLFWYRPTDDYLLKRSFRQLTCDKCETPLGYTKGLHDDWIICIKCKKKLKELKKDD